MIKLTLRFIISLCFMCLLIYLFFLFVDRPFVLWLAKVEPKWLYEFFEIFTHIFDTIFLGKFLYLSNYYAWGSVMKILVLRYLPLGLMAWLSFQIFQKKALAKVFIWVIICHGFSTLSALFLKYLISRPRPDLLLEKGVYHLSFPGGLGDSLPSGHTIDYMALFLPFALYYRSYAPWIMIIPLGIAIGRIILFMHFPSDVITATYLASSTAFISNRLIFKAQTLNKSC